MFPSSDEAGGNEGNKCRGGCYAPIEPSGKNETDAAKSGSYPDSHNDERAPHCVSHGVSGAANEKPRAANGWEGRRGPCGRR